MNIKIRFSLIKAITIILLMMSLSAFAGGSIIDMLVDDAPKETFLPPDVAFKMHLEQKAGTQVLATFIIAPGHYLYKSRIQFTSPDATIHSVVLPDGDTKEDPNFGTQEVYHHNFVAEFKIEPKNTDALVKVNARYQGCSESGLCYAPIRKTIELAVPNIASSDKDVVTGQSQKTTVQPIEALDNPASILETGNIWLVVAGFFVAGLLLSLTPCVLPMIPILSSIIVGSQSDQESPSKLQAFLLSVAYVLGMALSYTLAGIAAGLSGSLVSQSLQNAWVLGATAIVFVLLSLSMFGFYELKLPASIESKMLNTTNKIKGGQFVGVFVMGALSALIVSPCVAAPLAGALLYIGQTQNVVLGGVGLFALAIGMGVPLLLIGASAGQILPKAGKWMTAVRNFFGVMMLAMAIWIVSSIVPPALVLGLWAALAVTTAVNLQAFDALPIGASWLQKLRKAIGLLLAIYGIALMIGALSGGKNVLQPLRHLFITSGVTSMVQNNVSSLNFTKVKSVQDLDQRIANAHGQPVMLDFYADWCVACKEMEEITFSDSGVQDLLKGTVLLQADVTENNLADKALLKRFGLFGPPGIIFFDRTGKVMKRMNVIGFQNVKNFKRVLAKRDQILTQ